MNKTVICPNIVVYHNALENYSEVLDLVKESESLSEKKYHLPPARQWLMYGLITQVDGSMDTSVYTDDEESKKQKHILSSVHQVYETVCDDFFSNHMDTKDFPEFVKNFNRKEDPSWRVSGISFLKYDIKDEDYYKNKAHITHNRTMGYHTDTKHYDIDSRGDKLIVTVTMYLNDEYDGGEICFLDTVTGKQYYYKPMPGDVTVFPSGEPYWHSVLPSYNADRYLARMFCLYNYPGSDEWLKNEATHGKEKWARMEKERQQMIWDTGLTQTMLVYPGEEVPQDSPYKILEIKSEPIKVLPNTID
jgi:hypothetical protein